MKKRIAIVGGGVAGLSAANFLVRAGCEVTVLEAKSDLGGRIWSIRNEGAMIELGAEFLHGENQSIRNVIQAAGLSTLPVSEDYYQFQHGLFQRTNFLGRIGKLIEHIYIQRRDSSFLEYLDGQNCSAPDREQAIGFVEGYHAADPARISAHALRRGEYSAQHMKSTRQSRMVEGYGALVDFLARDIRLHGGHLLTGVPVEKIAWQPGRVELSFHDDVRNPLHADAAIITLPLGVLKAGSVVFSPSLGVKREAIEQLNFGNVIKMIFQFRERWWPDFGFVVALHEAFPTWWTDSRGPVLTAWAGGPKADALLGRSPAELEKIGLEVMSHVFNKYAGAISTQFISSHHFNWARDPFTRGAYSYLPVNGLDLPKLLGAPMAGTLFFAGEATVTDAQMGTVFGAFETGLRAGREVLSVVAGSSAEAVSPPGR